MNRPNFQIERFDTVIAAKLNGQWNSAIDLKYLSELGAAMQRMRQNTWVIIVDLRDWYVEDTERTKNTNYSLHLDRRNQIGECWIVREQSQAKHLDPFFETLEFKPKRVISSQDMQLWAEKMSVQIPESVLEWFDKEH